MYPPACALFLAGASLLGQEGSIFLLVAINSAAWFFSAKLSAFSPGRPKRNKLVAISHPKSAGDRLYLVELPPWPAQPCFARADGWCVSLRCEQNAKLSVADSLQSLPRSKRFQYLPSFIWFTDVIGKQPLVSSRHLYFCFSFAGAVSRI